MGVTTWVDRITDDSNQWLSAGRAEEARDYSTAAVLYLKDASSCVARGSPVRAALSCYCAAECVSRMGASSYADRLYFEAGRLYSSVADHGVSGSIREALWALQRAYACYSLAGGGEESRRTLESYRFLVRRANPFAIGSEWLTMPEPPSRDREGPSTDEELPQALRGAFEELFAPRGPSALAPRSMNRHGPGGVMDDQESFVGQLG